LPDNPPVGDASPESATPSGCGDGIIDLAAGEQCDPGSEGLGATNSGCNPDCTMQCSGNSAFLWARNNHCYEVAPLPASRLVLEADRMVCFGMLGGAHVATFASDEEFRAVAGHVDAGWFWLGLEESADNDDYTSLTDLEPGWSVPCSGCYAHNPDLARGLPASSATGSDAAYCVQASSDLTQPAWQKVPCDGVSPAPHVVCEREPVGSQARPCDAGICIHLVWTYGTKSYVYGAVPLSADDGEQACHGLGGRLVVLGSRDEREQLWKELGKLTVVPPAVWVGLSQRSVGGVAGTPDAGRGDATTEWVWDDDASADAYPSEWGFNRPMTGSNRSTRAYLIREPTQQSDNTLARDDGPMPTSLPYVCEVAGDAGASN